MRIYIQNDAFSPGLVNVSTNRRNLAMGDFILLCRRIAVRLAKEHGKTLPKHPSIEVVSLDI